MNARTDGRGRLERRLLPAVAILTAIATFGAAAGTQTVTVPPDVKVSVALTEQVTSLTSHVGDTFRFKTTRAVRLGDVAIPAGTPGHGRIASVSPAYEHHNGAISLQADSIDLADGRALSVNIDPARPMRGRLSDKHTKFKVLFAVVVLIPVVKTTRDGNLVLEPGTPFGVITTLPRATPAPLITATPTALPLPSASPKPMGSGMAKPMASGMPKPMGSGMPKPLGSGIPMPTGSGMPMPMPMGSGMPRAMGSGNPSPMGSGNPSPMGSGNPRPMGSGNPSPMGSGMPMPMGSGMPMPLGSAMPTPMRSGMPKPVASGMPAPRGSGMPMPLPSGGPAPMASAAATP